MPFDVGDKVVYPHHGAATIEKREKVEAFGKKQDYLILRLAYGDLTLKVPADNADEIGLRDVINDEEVEEVFAVLRKKEARMPTNWSRRFKNHVEKLKSGDIYQVAEVVRNLTIREKDKGLSAGEKRMLARARQILVSELTFALDVDEETAEDKLDEVLGKPPTTGRRSSIDFDDDGALTKAPPPITPSKPRKARRQGRGEDGREAARPRRAKAAAKATKAGRQAREGDEGHQSQVTAAHRTRRRRSDADGQVHRGARRSLRRTRGSTPVGRRIVVFVEIVRLFTVVLVTAVGFMIGQDLGVSDKVAAGFGMLGCLAGYLIGGFLGRLLERAVGVAER